jgi:hypothetical protein
LLQLLCLLSAALLNIFCAALLFGFVLFAGVLSVSAYNAGLVLSRLQARSAAGDIGYWFCIGFMGVCSPSIFILGGCSLSWF